MKITVISDTHGDFETLYRIVEKNSDSDQFIHLGDGEHEFEAIQAAFYEKPFIFIRGNNDWGDYPQNLIIEFGGKKFFLCHGHRFDQEKLAEFLAVTASANGCHVALFGHTHKPYREYNNGILLFNPGSPTLPRCGDLRTYGIIMITENGEIFAEHNTI